MLSTKSPSNPSCSSKLPALRTGEIACEKLAFRDRDPILKETPSADFSIRDYVFASRSKGIKSSWPFTQQLLQLCVKHGVKDLLPPFEPPCLVSVQCCRKGVEPVQPIVFSVAEQVLAHVDPQVEAPSIRQGSCSPLKKPSPDVKLISSQRTGKYELAHCDAGIGLTRTNHQVGRTSSEIDGLAGSLDVDRCVFEAPSEIDIVEPTKKLESSREALEKNCRLIVKLGVTSESSWAEDIVSNSSTILDPMASKICPVCRTFSSTSNTTLNAHIDQCLSTESNTKWVSSKLLKPRVKPGKKRLMVDIYATASQCTLEDLDERNGTNWAVELAFAAAPTVAVDMEAKKPKVLPTDSRGDVSEGAVYVDSNGIKLRILSKLNDTPQPKEELKLQKHAKVIETSRSFLISNKKHHKAKYPKKMKVKAQRKKLNSFMLSKAQIQTTPEGDCNAETHHENGESLLHMSDPGSIAKGSRSSSLCQWMCSRQSDVSKKLVSKNVHSTPSDNTTAVSRSRLAESSQLDPGNSSVAISHHLKFSKLSKDLTSSSKTNKNDLLSKMVHSMDDSMNKSENLRISTSRWSAKSIVKNGCLLRISKSCGNSVASSRRKTKQIDLGIQHQSDDSSERTNIASEICCTSMKDQVISSWKKNNSVRRSPFNSETRKGDLTEKLSTCKRFRRHRSIFRSGKSGAEFRSATNGVHGPGTDIVRTSKALGSCELDHSTNVTISGAGEMINHASPNRKDVAGSEERDDRSTMEKKKCNTLRKLCLGTEYLDLDIENLDMQVEVVDIGNYVSKRSMKLDACNPHPNDTLTSKNLQTDFGATLEPSPMVAHAVCPFKSEVHVGQLVQRFEKQEVSCGDASRKEIDDQDIRIADEMEDTADKDSFEVHPTECTVDTLSIQESSGCLTSHGDDVGPAIPQKSTSITSVRTIANNTMNLGSDGEPCGSPVSTASTISLHSPKGSTCTDSESEASAIHAQDKLLLIAPITENTITAEERNVKGKTQELKANLSAKEPDHSVDDKPFCCSFKESLSRESQLLRQNTSHRTAKGKQASNLFARPRVSSSFSSYQNRRTNTTTVISSLQPAAQSTSNKGLSDSAAKFPTCSDLGSAIPSSRSQNQSISNPILRLMGKNLMVGNNEEFLQPQSVVLDYKPQVNFLSPLGLASTSNLLKQENFPYHHFLIHRSF